MASLLEIANAPRQVEIRGVKVDVYGISGETLAILMVRFPEVGKMLSGLQVDDNALAKLAPKALAACIAAGTGFAGDDKAEQAAAKLGVGEQLELIDEIMRLTFPRGIGPFVEKLQGLGLFARVEEQPAADQKAPSPSVSQSSQKN